ncbi:hypothetical protein J32TS6_40790 [Virgibacillus pantothenticus]|uniref:phosphodiester glycosidase family protein n=1 Tax=Virgibacillus TaxID=84406 RepID=UPI0009095584|nr:MULTISPECIES: phosphodiester glycosidase family protein [Virgibacillus]API91700.1 hypothetical protein BKP57_07585 [Virgibacillus sp. 6R]MBS7427813.1 phosphodiester glycosidase family protein [Virgibacillus sp. 19R1-5]GIP65524.1 hypothetical protein J32TS6_40790 [Virgibacillus pantothenticus]
MSNNINQENYKMNAGIFYNEVTIERLTDRDTNTTYFITKIPKNDSQGRQITLKRGFSYNDFDNTNLETPRSFAARNAATFVANCSTYSTTTRRVVGTSIYKGKIQQERKKEKFNYILAISDDNTLRAYPPSTNAKTILNDGFNNALTSFIPMIQNGTKVDNSILTSRDIFTKRHPRQAIAQDSSGNIYFLTSEGRRAGEKGLTVYDLVRIFLSMGMDFAFMLDGGGSAQTVYHGSTVNRVSDGYGKDERTMLDFLYVGKDQPDNSINEALRPLGIINKMKSDELAEFEYHPDNHERLKPYLINGWKDFGTSGSGVSRAWHMPNNTIYFIGSIKGGDPNKPFMELPDHMRPMFSLHFLVPGNKPGEIYKVIVQSNGELQMYYWSDESKGDAGYIRLDGIYIPVWPPNAQ